MRMASALTPILVSGSMFATCFAEDANRHDQILAKNGITPNATGILNYIRPIDEKQLSALIQRLGDPDYSKREQATSYLSSLSITPMFALEKACNSPDAEIRFRARTILKRSRLKDNSDVLYAALMKMRGKEYRAGVPILLRLIPSLRRRKLVVAAAEAIRQIADSGSAQALRTGLKSEHADVRNAALNALATVLGKSAKPDIRLLLKDEVERVRFSAAAALVSLGDRAPLNMLCGMLESNDIAIRAGASRLLRTVTGKRLGYIAYDKSPARSRAVRRWKTWARTEGRTVKLLPLKVVDATGESIATVSARLRYIMTGHTSTVYCVAFSPDGKTLASAGGDRSIRLWDAATGNLLKTLEGHRVLVRAVAFSPDGRILASASYDKTIKFWRPGTGTLIRTLTGHTGAVRIIAFSPDGKLLASSSSDRTVRLWNVGTGTTVRILKGHATTTRCVAFSPDGKTVVSSSSDYTIKLWDVQTGALHATLTGHTSSVRSVVFTPDGRTLISGSLDKSVRLWDLESGKERAKLSGHTSSVKAVDVSPDGRFFVSTGNDSALRFWDADTGNLFATVRGHTSATWHVAFSPDGKTVASCGSDRTVRIWRIERVIPAN